MPPVVDATAIPEPAGVIPYVVEVTRKSEPATGKIEPLKTAPDDTVVAWLWVITGVNNDAK